MIGGFAMAEKPLRRRAALQGVRVGCHRTVLPREVGEASGAV
jgi:hypothetical protein